MEKEKDLFEIFPDLISPARIRPPARQGVPSIDHPPPPTTHIARRRTPVADRETEIVALRTLHHSDQVALRRIRDVAQVEYTRLTPTDRVARALRKIMMSADGALRIAAKRAF